MAPARGPCGLEVAVAKRDPRKRVTLLKKERCMFCYNSAEYAIAEDLTEQGIDPIKHRHKQDFVCWWCLNRLHYWLNGRLHWGLYKVQGHPLNPKKISAKKAKKEARKIIRDAARRSDAA